MKRKSNIFLKIITGILIFTVFYYISYLAMNSLMPDYKRAKIPSRLDELQKYIDDEETKTPGIRWNSRKSIRWYDQIMKRSDYVILYVHGYTATKYEITPVVEKFADNIKANVFYTRLKGSGQGEGTKSKEDLKYTKGVELRDWEYDFDEAFKIARKIGDKIIIMGTSTGATLALHMVYNRKEYKDFFTFIFVSPNFGPINKKTIIFNLPGGRWITPIVNGSDYILDDDWADVRDSKKKDIDTGITSVDYPFSMMSLVWKVNNKLKYKETTYPMLVFYSQNDQTVNYQETESFLRKYVGKKVVKIVNNSSNKGQHLITGQYHAPEMVDKFVEDMTNYVIDLNKNSQM